MNITQEQAAYIEAAGHGKDIGVEALAGVGKTSTGFEMCKQHPNKKIRFIVYNKKNAEEMQKILPPNAVGATKHFTCLKWFRRRPFVNSLQGAWKDKLSKNLKCLFEINPDWNFTEMDRKDVEYSLAYENASSGSDLLSLAKNTFVITPTVQEVAQLALNHGITFTGFGYEQVIIDALSLSDNDLKEIDFDDMVRLPVLNKYIVCDSDIFILDEAQDSPPTTIELFKQMAEKCEVHWFGDRWQSISGFMGADTNAMDKIAAAINPETIFPLTINFRCSKAVIAETRLRHPHIDIKAWDGALEGSVQEIDLKHFHELMKPGDCAIARFNKIIIPMAFRLLKAGKRATVQGNKDFVKQITRIIKSIRAQDMRDFNDKLQRQRERALSKTNTELGQEIINDKFDCIEVFADNASTQQEMIQNVEDMFSGQASDYKLSTAHRSKGLQFTNVFMLDHNNFTAKQAKTKEQLQQEENLQYVARTRAQDGLYYVNMEKE